MWQKLLEDVDIVKSNIMRDLEVVKKSAKDKWREVLVKCPSCKASLKPPADAKLFTCTNCGSRVNDPSIIRRASYHVTEISNIVNAAISEKMNYTTRTQVVVPDGASGGSKLELIFGPDVDPYFVTVPDGLQAGETFTAEVPQSLFFRRPPVADGEAAPSLIPVAKAVDLTAPVSEPSGPPPIERSNSSRSTLSERENIQRLHQEDGEWNRQAIEEWEKMLVKCPSCARVLQPPQHVKVFACDGCGSNINRPGFGTRLDYHMRKMSSRIDRIIHSAVGQTIDIEVKVPEGVQAGQEFDVPVGREGKTHRVTVPDGVSEGQTFTAKVPIALTDEPVLVCDAKPAPVEIPAAEIVRVSTSWSRVTGNVASASSSQSSPIQEAAATLGASSSDSVPGGQASFNPPPRFAGEADEDSSPTVFGRPASESTLTSRPILASSILDEDDSLIKPDN